MKLKEYQKRNLDVKLEKLRKLEKEFQEKCMELGDCDEVSETSDYVLLELALDTEIEHYRKIVQSTKKELRRQEKYYAGSKDIH